MDCHNPYFSRWFSAIIHYWDDTHQVCTSHNPYFSRWFSAIVKFPNEFFNDPVVTILILVDGFLQYISAYVLKKNSGVTILILVDGFLQYNSKNQIYQVFTVTILILVDGFLQYDIWEVL